MKFLIAIVAAMFLSSCTEPATEKGLKALVGGRLEASLGAEPIPFSVVIIADGKIRSAGPQASTPVPKGAETISTKGKVIRPMPSDGKIAVDEPANLMIFDAETGAPDRIMQDGEWIR